jgi:hypothetical protein
MHTGPEKSNIGSHNGEAFKLYQRDITGPNLKDAVISAYAFFDLAIAEEMKGLSGKFYHLTNYLKNERIDQS